MEKQDKTNIVNILLLSNKMLSVFFLPFLLTEYSNGFFISPKRGPISITRIQNSVNNVNNIYPFSKFYYTQYQARLQAKNITLSSSNTSNNSYNYYHITMPPSYVIHLTRNPSPSSPYKQNFFGSNFGFGDDDEDEDEDQDDDDGQNELEKFLKREAPKQQRPTTNNPEKIKKFLRENPPTRRNGPKKSENFELLEKSDVFFKDIGGYDNIKTELLQCVDILTNYTKYAKYNVRTPKGLILEGPPGNGKTMFAKGLAGEAKSSFIAVSGSEFQEKYVGVGSSRVRELFELARENAPCIIFIDEIDAIGRKRSTDSESSSSERDSTLNQLLINMDGFDKNHGIFVIGATNRADLLDPALIRPGRIDKRIYIGLPDADTRKQILTIHLKGKPHDTTVTVESLVDLTMGLSASQLENLLNEAMLHAIRSGLEEQEIQFKMTDVELVLNRIVGGYSPIDHKFTDEMLDQIAIHEMGHAMVGFLAKHHSKLIKVVINLSSPNTPGFTQFENSLTSLYTREALFEHLMILLAGRIAEEVFYNRKLMTTGAISDLSEAYKLAEELVMKYGMGSQIIYPALSQKYMEKIDAEVLSIIQDAYTLSSFLVTNCKDAIQELSQILKKDKILRAESIMEIVQKKYPQLFDLYTR